MQEKKGRNKNIFRKKTIIPIEYTFIFKPKKAQSKSITDSRLRLMRQLGFTYKSNCVVWFLFFDDDFFTEFAFGRFDFYDINFRRQAFYRDLDTGLLPAFHIPIGNFLTQHIEKCH